jgi:hypothetical protein
MATAQAITAVGTITPPAVTDFAAHQALCLQAARFALNFES